MRRDKAVALVGLIAMWVTPVTANPESDVISEVDRLVDSMTGCNAQYQIEMYADSVAIEGKLLDLQLKYSQDPRGGHGSRQEVIEDYYESRDYEYKECVEEARQTESELLSKVKSLAKTPEQRSSAKAFFAQFAATADSVPKKNFANELSRLKAAAADLRFELE